MQGRKRRLFYAVFPDEHVREQLAALAGQHHQRTAHQHHPKDLHMTLAFLGMQSYDMHAAFKTIGDAIDTPAFNVVIDQIGYWKGPRILWAAPSNTPEILAGLVDALWEGLEDCGVERENRAFKPHITLQRKARAIKTVAIEPIHWRVEKFSLAWSKDNATPPRYEKMEEWSLY